VVLGPGEEEKKKKGPDLEQQTEGGRKNNKEKGSALPNQGGEIWKLVWGGAGRTA